jgi:hypothetical protein
MDITIKPISLENLHIDSEEAKRKVETLIDSHKQI